MAERIVEVEWEDSCGRCGWQPLVGWPNEAAPGCRSVGYVLGEDGRGIRAYCWADTELGGQREAGRLCDLHSSFRHPQGDGA